MSDIGHAGAALEYTAAKRDVDPPLRVQIASTGFRTTEKEEPVPDIPCRALDQRDQRHETRAVRVPVRIDLHQGVGPRLLHPQEAVSTRHRT